MSSRRNESCRRLVKNAQILLPMTRWVDFPDELGIPFYRRYLSPTAILVQDNRVLRISSSRRGFYMHFHMNNTCRYTVDTKEGGDPPNLPILHGWDVSPVRNSSMISVGRCVLPHTALYISTRQEGLPHQTVRRAFIVIWKLRRSGGRRISVGVHAT